MGTRLGASRETNRPVSWLSAQSAASSTVFAMRKCPSGGACPLGLQGDCLLSLLPRLYKLAAAGGFHSNGGCGNSEGGSMNAEEARCHLRELAKQLPGLREAEEQAAAAVAEAWLVVRELDREQWTGSGRGRLDLAIADWRKAEARHREVAQKLEENLRQAGKLRRNLEAAPRMPGGGVAGGQGGSAE